jgi:hypothetical protein
VELFRAGNSGDPKSYLDVVWGVADWLHRRAASIGRFCAITLLVIGALVFFGLCLLTRFPIASCQEMRAKAGAVNAKILGSCE